MSPPRTQRQHRSPDHTADHPAANRLAPTARASLALSLAVPVVAVLLMHPPAALVLALSVIAVALVR